MIQISPKQIQMADSCHLEKIENHNISKTVQLILVKFGKLNPNGQKNQTFEIQILLDFLKM